MKEIKVVDFLGTPVLLSRDKGLALLDEIVKVLESDATVMIDFKDYRFISSAFLNNSLGQLCIDKDWNVSDFGNHINVRNLNDDDMDDLQIVIHNAQYRKDLLKSSIDPKEFYASFNQI